MVASLEKLLPVTLASQPASAALTAQLFFLLSGSLVQHFDLSGRRYHVC